MILANENYVEVKGKILAIKDLGQRDFEIAKWALSFLRDYRFKALPGRPGAVNGYYSQADEERRKMNHSPAEYSKFWNNPEVMEYFEAAQKIKHLNYANYEFLLWMKEILKGEVYSIDIEYALSTHKTQKIDQPDWTE